MVRLDENGLRLTSNRFCWGLRGVKMLPPPPQWGLGVSSSYHEGDFGLVGRAISIARPFNATQNSMEHLSLVFPRCGNDARIPVCESPQISARNPTYREETRLFTCTSPGVTNNQSCPRLKALVNVGSVPYQSGRLLRQDAYLETKQIRIAMT